MKGGTALLSRASLLLLVMLALPASARAQTEQVEYYALDAIGSVRAVFDASGHVLARLDYQPFGAELSPTSKGVDRKFAQLFRDPEAGLDYAEARSYQVRTGRFISPDPLYDGLYEPQRWNRFSYSLSNSLSFVDPEGLNPQLTGCSHAGCTGTDSVTVIGQMPGSTSGGSDGGAYGAAGVATGGRVRRPNPDPDRSGHALGGGSSNPATPSINPLTDLIGMAAPVTAGLGEGAVNGVLGVAMEGVAAALAPKLSTISSFAAQIGRSLGLRPKTVEYADRIWKTDGFHTFPRSVDRAAIKHGTIDATDPKGYTMWKIPGQMDGRRGPRSGTFEIGGYYTGATSFVVTHRFFRPFKQF